MDCILFIRRDFGDINVDNEFGRYADEILYCLKDVGFANEYYEMNNTQRLKFLNEILQTLGYYGSYDISEG